MANPSMTRITDQILSDRIGHGHSGHWQTAGVNEIGGHRMPDTMTIETGENEKYSRVFDADGVAGPIMQMSAAPNGEAQPWSAAAHPGIDRKFEVALSGFQEKAKVIQPQSKNAAESLASNAQMTGLRAQAPRSEQPHVGTAVAADADAAPQLVATAGFQIGFKKGSAHLSAKDDSAIMREAKKIKAALGRGGHAQLRLLGTADNSAFKSDSYDKNQALADQRVDVVQAELDKDLKKLGVETGKVAVTKATQLGQASRSTKGALSVTL